MRRFSSYGPGKEIIEFACRQLLGENPEKGEDYITVWHLDIQVSHGH